MGLGTVKVRTGTKVTQDEYKEVKVDLDYTQVYGCFNTIAHRIKSVTSFKLLFWLLSNKTDRANNMDCSYKSFVEFNEFLGVICPECIISEPTYYKCLKELVATDIIKRHGRNNYVANIFVLWKGRIEDRGKIIGLNEAGGEPVFINPITQEQLDADIQDAELEH